MAALGALIKRRRILDVEWVNKYLHQIISQESSAKAKINLLRKLHPKVVSMENYEALVEQIRRETAASEGELEHTRLETLIENRYNLYKKYQTDDLSTNINF